MMMTMMNGGQQDGVGSWLHILVFFCRILIASRTGASVPPPRGGSL
jgi:hypothetical protein